MRVEICGSSKLGLMVILLAVACGAAGAQVLSTVGGAVTLGPAPGAYFQPAPAPAVDEALLSTLMSAPRQPILLQADDEVRIELYGVKEFETKARVDRNGTVQLPYVGPVKLAGLSVSEAENLIAADLTGKDLVLEPAVTIEVTAQPSATVLVTGEVPHPGAFPLYANPTLDSVIASGGGFLADASPVVTITRAGYATPIAVPLGPGPERARFGGLPLLAGDRVLISRIGLYYVVGAIKNQGSYALKSTTPTTVLQALAAAGGFNFEAILNSTQIVRTVGDHRVFIPVSAGKILKGKAPDVPLLNDDIVFVPTSATKAAIKGGATGLIVTIAQSYIYTHP